MTRRAATLDETLDVLELLPLDFGGARESPAADPAFYVEPPTDEAGADEVPPPPLAEALADRLPGPRHGTTLFLSGHVGSGKSTQLSKLAADDRIQKAFSVVPLRVEAEHRSLEHLYPMRVLHVRRLPRRRIRGRPPRGRRGCPPHAR